MAILKSNKVVPKHSRHTVGAPSFGTIGLVSSDRAEPSKRITHEMVAKAIARYFAMGGKLHVLPDQVVKPVQYVRAKPSDREHAGDLAAMSDILYGG